MERGVQTERLTIIVDVHGRAGVGKTAALASIVRHLQDLVGAGLEIHGINSSMELYKRVQELPPITFDRNDVRVVAEVYHRG
jgi:hypothetical protein